MVLSNWTADGYLIRISICIFLIVQSVMNMHKNLPGGPGGPSIIPVGNWSPLNVVVNPLSPFSPWSPCTHTHT